MNNLEFDNDLLALLPPWYREILDYQAICNAEAQQFELLAQEIVAVADNFFFQTMDVGSVLQWEQILGIVANPSTETLAFRQARLINRISMRPPYTLGFLYQRLDDLIGPGQWEVTVDYQNYTLYIKSYAQNQSYATELAVTIGRIKPAHIVFVSSAYVATPIALSETITGASRQWNYIMSAWPLGEQPFATDTPTGVIKLATVPSVQTDLLEDVANFMSGDVYAARINGTLVITALTKSVSGSTLTVSYTVQQSQVSVITLVELIDVYGNALTSSTCYIPLTESTKVLEHSIPVQEGAFANA